MPKTRRRPDDRRPKGKTRPHQPAVIDGPMRPTQGDTKALAQRELESPPELIQNASNVFVDPYGPLFCRFERRLTFESIIYSCSFLLLRCHIKHYTWRPPFRGPLLRCLCLTWCVGCSAYMPYQAQPTCNPRKPLGVELKAIYRSLT